ncbi:CBSCBS2 [Scenedesmus sp. PABB004]|nr:CBSCBS2 [Scenedesmus sp. PABB004]
MPASDFAAALEFLKQQHLGPLLSAVNQNLVKLNKWDTVGKALQVLGTTNVLSAPVLDEDGEYFGCLSVNDLLKSLYKVLAADDAEWFEKIDAITPARMVEVATTFSKQTVDKIQHAGDLWLLNADDASTLLDAVMESFRIQDRAVHHRLFVCSNAHEQKSNTMAGTTVINITPGSERLSASGLNVTHVVSQSDVVKLLWANKAVLGGALNQTVEQLELDAGKAFSVPASMTALEAFSQMARDHKSSVGVVDPAGGKLLGNLSVSDLRGLAVEDFPLLLLTVGEYIAARRGLPALSKADALAGKRAEAATSGDWASLLAGAPAVSVTGASTLEAVLEALAVRGLHRVYVVDGDGKASSIITLTDVLRLITKPDIVPPPPRISMEVSDDDDEDRRSTSLAGPDRATMKLLFVLATLALVAVASAQDTKPSNWAPWPKVVPSTVPGLWRLTQVTAPPFPEVTLAATLSGTTLSLAGADNSTGAPVTGAGYFYKLSSRSAGAGAASASPNHWAITAYPTFKVYFSNLRPDVAGSGGWFTAVQADRDTVYLYPGFDAVIPKPLAPLAGGWSMTRTAGP